MTSKQALEELERINKRQNNGNGDIWLEMIIQSIRKDLEVLEILKYCITDKSFMYDTDSDSIQLKIEAKKLKPYCDKDGNQLFPVTIDSDYEKVKEWLENDK